MARTIWSPTCHSHSPSSDVEGLFLNAMHVEAGGKARRHRPFEHRSVLRILSGHEEHHRLAGQRDLLALARHSNDCFCAHDAPPWSVLARTTGCALQHEPRQPPKVVNSFRKSCKIFPNGPTQPMATIHEFGPFRLDADAEMLFRGAEPTVLGQRAVALLRLLLERAGEPVSKDALIEAAWPGLAIEDSNLTVQIAALRRVFEEVGRRQRIGSRLCRAAATAMSGRRSQRAISPAEANPQTSRRLHCPTSRRSRCFRFQI